MDILPVEIICFILSFIEDISYCRLVCSLWKDILEERWNARKVNLKLIKNNKYFKRGITFYLDKEFFYISTKDTIKIYKINNFDLFSVFYGKKHSIIIKENFYYIKNGDLYIKDNILSVNERKLTNDIFIYSYNIFNNILLISEGGKLCKYEDKLIFLNFKNVLKIETSNKFLYISKKYKIIRLNGKYEKIGKIHSNYVINDFVSDKYDNIFILKIHCSNLYVYDKSLNLITTKHVTKKPTNLFINDNRRIIVNTKKDDYTHIFLFSY